MQLISTLSGLNRCHSSDEMEQAYQLLVSHYPESNLLTTPNTDTVNHWKIPPRWMCSKAELTDDAGNSIASMERHNLEVFSYSPSVSKTLPLSELQPHLLSDPNRPDAICFHFRNQYRHWNPEWGFSIPHRVRKSLSEDTVYHVNIESEFNHDSELIQSDYFHQGDTEDTFLFVGHFDHPSQVNDGLVGCIAAYEIIDRLKDRNTKFSYRAFASVEIVGSVYYLASNPNIAENVKESLFLAFSGIPSPLAYQQSFKKRSMIDRIAQYILSFYENENRVIFEHRQLVGNDENAFDSVGHEIPSGTLLRWPFPEYHTQFDTMEITSKDQIEEVIEFVMQIIEVLEENKLVQSNFVGLPCLSNPEIDLYLSGNVISGIHNPDHTDISKFNCELHQHEKDYLSKNKHLLNQFMQNIVRMSDGKHSIFDIAEKSKIPFNFALMYANLLNDKGLVELLEIQP